MKKILRAIALLFAPVLLYYAVFLAFEPNNFFGLRGQTPSGAVFGAMRQYRQSPTPGIILGDSRTAHIDMDTINGTTGRSFSNLSFGGASFHESLDQLQWLLQRYPEIEEVVFSLSFYTINTRYDYDRFSTIERAMNNPFVYLTSLSYNLEMLQNLRDWMAGKPLGGGELETRDPASYQWADYTNPITGQVTRLRTDIIQYLSDIGGYVSDWQPDTEHLEEFLALMEDYTARGVRFVVVLPPIHTAVLQQAVQPNGIQDAMLPLIEQLRQSSAALVLDYEFTQRYPFEESDFYDGFHLDYNRGLKTWAQLLAEAIR